MPGKEIVDEYEEAIKSIKLPPRKPGGRLANAERFFALVAGIERIVKESRDHNAQKRA